MLEYYELSQVANEGIMKIITVIWDEYNFCLLLAFYIYLVQYHNNIIIRIRYGQCLYVLQIWLSIENQFFNSISIVKNILIRFIPEQMSFHFHLSFGHFVLLYGKKNYTGF